MEKYTFDIDKVLDDFEETEALKINSSHKNADTSLLQPTVNNPGEKLKGNKEDSIFKSKGNVDVSTVNESDKNSLYSDKNVLQNALPDVNKCIELCDNSDKNMLLNALPDEKFLESCDTSEVEYTNENGECKYVSSVHKPNTINCTSNTCSVTLLENNTLKVDKHEEVVSSESILSDNSKCNILSKSISLTNAPNIGKTCFNFSMLQDQNSLSLSNKSISEGTKIIECPHNTPVNTFIHSEVLKENSQDNVNSKNSDNEVKELTTPNCEIPFNAEVEREFKSDINKYDSYLNENLEHTCTVVNKVNSSDGSQLTESGAHALSLETSTSNLQHPHTLQLDYLYCTYPTTEENKKSADKCDVSELFAVEENNYAEEKNLTADRNNDVDAGNDSVRDIQVEDRNDEVHDRNFQIQNRNEHNEPGLLRRGFQELEYDDVSDDDSGVSSDEAGNSPLFFFNNRMFNFNEGAHVDVRNQEIPGSQSAYSSCDNPENGSNSVCEINATADSSSALIVNNDDVDVQPVVDKTFSSENSGNIQSDKFTGARPKLEGMIQISLFSHRAVGTVADDSTNEYKDMIIESVNESDILPSEKILQQCDDSERSDTMLFYCSNSRDSDDVHGIKCESDAVKSDGGESMPENVELHDTNIEIHHCEEGEQNGKDVNTNTEGIEVASQETEANIKKSDSVIKAAPSDNELVSVNNETENVTNSDSQSDSLPRLPRPTTLDLPSRHVIHQASSEIESTSSESSNLPLSGANFVSIEASTDNDDTEPSPVKQQPQLGLVKPFWIPDADAPNCMHCGVKFTVIKRRHHCRACGKVLCSRCCNLRAKLAYLNKEDRICHPCFEILSSALQNDSVPAPVVDSQSSSSCGSSPNFSPSPQIPSANFGDKNSWRPHPNNPDDYCSTIPPLQQIQLSGTRPPPTVMVPIGVLKRGNKPRREPKQVIFSDGIRPGGDLTDLTEPVDAIPVYRRMGRKRIEKAISESASAAGSSIPFVPSKCRQKKVLVSDEEGPLPPLVLHVDNDKTSEEKTDWNHLLERMQDDDQKPINFALLKNMHLYVKLTKLDCCFGKECWCFTSNGLCAVGQDEIMVILERLPGENILPRGILKLYTHIYDSASKGSTFDDLGHIIFPEQILGNSDHRGFLFVRPTFQCLSKLVVPNSPFLVAILIHKWEVPWAKVFPLRLMLRLGAECRYYPCALVSVRHRKPVFFEIGQTIMSVLADLRNYQFTIPVIPGLVVHMEEKKTCVNIPRNRYEKVMKVLNSNNVEHVLALGSNFSSEADSHLVCMQKEEGEYQTQAINIENTTRRVTGASFIVFSGALKSSSGLSAKFSIVEDGLLVQIPQETMVSLHVALRDMKDLTIECGQINAAEPEEVVIVQWTRDDKKFNVGVRSPIDGKSLEGIPNVRIHTSTDYAGENYLIRWIEVFFLEVDENSSSSIQHELVDPCRLAETVAQSCCMALTPYLDQLAESELTKIGLRVTLDSEKDRVEYDIGAHGKPLPAAYMNALDCGLIPVILRLSGSAQSEPISFELIFHILIK